MILTIQVSGMVVTLHGVCSYFYYICTLPFSLSSSCWVSYKSCCTSFIFGFLLVPNPKTEKYSIVAVSNSQAIMVA